MIEIPGRRFGLTSVPPWQLGDLRAGGFDQVIIPQMNERSDEYMNVYRFVLSLNPASVAIIAGEALPREFDRGEFLAFVLGQLQLFTRCPEARIHLAEGPERLIELRLQVALFLDRGIALDLRERSARRRHCKRALGRPASRASRWHGPFRRYLPRDHAQQLR